MRFFSQTVALLLVLAFAVGAGAQTTGNRQASLEQRLVLGLRVRIPSEFEFIDAVLDTVNRGELPTKVVDQVFFWSRLKARQRTGRRPIIYFQPALTRVAKQLGVVIQANPPGATGS